MQYGFPERAAGILIGMTIGSDAYIDSETKNNFIGSGISHILVVSGSNIAFLIILVTFILKYFRIGRLGRISIIGVIISTYGFLVGWDISVIRAVIMGILSYIIAENNAKTSSIATLALAGLLLTIYAPLGPVYDAGF